MRYGDGCRYRTFNVVDNFNREALMFMRQGGYPKPLAMRLTPLYS